MLKHDTGSDKEDRLPLDGLSILVIDDTEDSLEATRILLEVLGACVLVARNGLEGLDVIGTSDCDLVLCDLRMPEMDGFEFLQKLSSVQGEARAPVVAVSGLASQADHQRTQAAGFAGHLDKPFDDHSLVMAVRLGLDHRRDVSRFPNADV
jgi:two-component system, chemotaxis family, CheB/CheR fusion protein